MNRWLTLTAVVSLALCAYLVNWNREDVLLRENEAVSKRNEMLQIRKKIFEKCRKEANLSLSQVEGMLNMRSTTGMNDHKCFLECVFEMYGGFTIDGSVNVDRFIEMKTAEFVNPNDKHKMEEILKLCLEKEKMVTNRCDYLFDLVNCVIGLVVKDHGGVNNWIGAYHLLTA